MTHKQTKRHYDALAKRYGICNIESFHISARRYERKLNRLALMICNDARNYEWAQEQFAIVSKRASETLSEYCRFNRKLQKELYFNRDPRGYALKIEANDLGYGIWTDWGGYGIVAPDPQDK